MRTQALILASVVIGFATPAAAAEICGNGLDDDADAQADEGCDPFAVTGVCENPVGCAITGAIAPKLGGVVYTLPPDLSPNVPFGPPLQFLRTYASLYEPPTGVDYRRPFGAHWQHNFMSWVELFTAPNPDQAIVHTTTGQDVLFKFNNTVGGWSYYDPQPGAHWDYLRQSTTSPFNWELRTLTGTVYVYNWTSPIGKLVEVRDSLSTPNKLTLTYNAAGNISDVTDAAGTHRLLFGYNVTPRINKVDYEVKVGSSWVLQQRVSYAYSGGAFTTTTIGSLVSTNTNASLYVTKIEDGAGNDIISFSYLSSTPGKVARIETGQGELGFDYNSTNPSCSGGTIVFSNRANTMICDDDADCGSGYRCGGETNPAGVNTGVCYRAAKCLQVISPNEDLIDTVAALTPCTGACAERTEYDWDTGTGNKVDLIGIKKADGNWTSFRRNADGLVTAMSEGDSDSDPTNLGSGPSTYFFYTNANFPGRVTEVRRLSDLKPGGTCTDLTDTDCAKTIYTWNAGGMMTVKQDTGFTLNASGTAASYSYTTTYTYDKGRLSLVDGPLAGSDDVTEFTFWTSTDNFKSEQRKAVRRKKNATDFLITTYDGYDKWSNSGSVLEPDGTYTCLTYHANRGYLTQKREAMNGQTSCATSHSSDLITNYTRDSWLRLTKTQYPLLNCEIREYDGEGRLSKIKMRDDCLAASGGDTIEYTYNDDGLKIKEETKDDAGTVKRRQEYAYLDSRHLGTMINPVATSYSRSYAYLSDGQPDTLTFENGLGKTQWLWDALDREDSRRRYKTSSTFDTWELSYAAGTPSRMSTSVLDDDDKYLDTVYDDLGRRVKQVNGESGITLYIYDAAGRVTTKVEAQGTGSEVSHAFTYDNLGRRLTEDYGNQFCQDPGFVETTYAYDASPVTCPSGAACTRQAGRLAYVKTFLMCDYGQPDNHLDQETFYAYDAAGRLVQEYIRDDTGRIAIQAYEFDKNGNQTKITPGSGIAMQFTYGGASSNADRDKVVTLARNPALVVNLATGITWMPYGPVSQYDQANTISGGAIRLMATWNLAYRPSELKYRYVATGADRMKIVFTEDEKGRPTLKNYTEAESRTDKHLQWDWQDRLVCDSSATGCTGTKRFWGETYSASNDRVLYHVSNTTYGTGNNFTVSYGINPPRGDAIDYITQSGPTSTQIDLEFDDRGNRLWEDADNSTTDRRDYFYDPQRRVQSIVGKALIGGGLHDYTLTNAYDHKNRRVFRSYLDNATSVESQYFFYYDLRDRLIEAKFIPDTSDTSTYTMYQFYWIGRRPVAYYATAYPTATVSRFFFHSDNANRPLEVSTWPATGDATITWATDPDIFGWDEGIATGAPTPIYQPLGLSNAYREDGTLAWSSGTSAARPGVLFKGGLLMDPLAGVVLRPQTKRWDPYNPLWGAQKRYSSEPRSTRQGGCSGLATEGIAAGFPGDRSSARVGAGSGFSNDSGIWWIEGGYWEGGGNNCADIPETEEGLNCVGPGGGGGEFPQCGNDPWYCFDQWWRANETCYDVYCRSYCLPPPLKCPVLICSLEYEDCQWLAQQLYYLCKAACGGF